MSITPLFPDAADSGKPAQEAFEREVAARFGLVPNFFRSAPDAPFVVHELWRFAQAAYLDAPIPTLFKERLFVYLSRFCEVRYCVTRHCGFLLGLGRAAGDPDAQAMTITQVIRSLQRPVPDDASISAALGRFEAVAEPIGWPSSETANDDDLFTLATILFLQPARAKAAKRALRIALGGEKFELLVGLLTFIRSAHYWTLMHPELVLEDDLTELLRQHEELSQLLSEDSEAGHCEMGARLFEELESLRELNARHGLENTGHALELKDRQKDLMLKEVDHRIKNSLLIVSSLLHLQARERARRSRNSTRLPREYRRSPPFTNSFTNPTTSERCNSTNTSQVSVRKLQPHHPVRIRSGGLWLTPFRSRSPTTLRCRSH
jgi:two-component sensor histidine kinase